MKSLVPFILVGPVLAGLSRNEYQIQTCARLRWVQRDRKASDASHQEFSSTFKQYGLLGS